MVGTAQAAHLVLAAAATVYVDQELTAGLAAQLAAAVAAVHRQTDQVAQAVPVARAALEVQAASQVQASHAAAAEAAEVQARVEAEAQAAAATVPLDQEHLQPGQQIPAAEVVLNIWQPTLRLAAPAS